MYDHVMWLCTDLTALAPVLDYLVLRLCVHTIVFLAIEAVDRVKTVSLANIQIVGRQPCSSISPSSQPLHYW